MSDEVDSLSDQGADQEAADYYRYYVLPGIRARERQRREEQQRVNKLVQQAVKQALSTRTSNATNKSRNPRRVEQPHF